MPPIVLLILIVAFAIVAGFIGGMIWLLARRRRAGIAALLVLLALCVAARVWWVMKVQPVLFMDDRAQMYRSAGVDIWEYVDDHDGAFPTDLTVLAKAPHVPRSPGSESLHCEHTPKLKLSSSSAGSRGSFLAGIAARKASWACAPASRQTRFASVCRGGRDWRVASRFV
jgi:hypothetical protein